MPTPTDLTPADTSSTVVPGLAAAPSRLSRTGRRARRAVRAEGGRSGRRARPRHGRRHRRGGTLDALARAGQANLVRAVAATGRPMVAVALRTPVGRDGLPARVSRRSARTRSIRRRWTRSPLRCSGVADVAGPAAGPPDGLRRAAMTLRDEILEQPEVAARFLASAVRRRSIALADAIRARDIEHVVIVARGTSRPCRDLRAVRPRHPARADRRAGHAVRGRRSTARTRGSATASSSRSASRARRRTSSRSWRRLAGRAHRRSR